MNVAYFLHLQVAKSLHLQVPPCNGFWLYKQHYSVDHIWQHPNMYMDSHVVNCCDIYWALTVVEKYYSFKISEDTSTLFTKMFPDSSSASKFACGIKKCSYLTSFFFSKLLLYLVRMRSFESNYFSL